MSTQLAAFVKFVKENSLTAERIGAKATLERIGYLESRLGEALAAKERAEAIAVSAKERFGPVGYKILKEHAEFKAERARLAADLTLACKALKDEESDNEALHMQLDAARVENARLVGLLKDVADVSEENGLHRSAQVVRAAIAQSPDAVDLWESVRMMEEALTMAIRTFGDRFPEIVESRDRFRKAWLNK